LTACPGIRAANPGGPDIPRDGDPAAAPVGLLVLAPLAGGLAAGVLLALGAGYAAVVVAGVLAQREPPYPM
jgi:hypothetical protein